MSLWKVYYIQSGKTLKAGFDSEEEARHWLEVNREGQEDNYLAEEMDFDEQDEWTAAKKKSEEVAEAEVETEEAAEDEDEDEDIEKGRYTYSTDDDDDEDDEEEGFIEEGEDEAPDDSSDGNVF